MEGGMSGCRMIGMETVNPGRAEINTIASFFGWEGWETSFWSSRKCYTSFFMDIEAFGVPHMSLHQPWRLSQELRCDSEIHVRGKRVIQ